MTELSPVLKQQFVGANGDPLIGGKLYSYAAGTSTPIPTYTDSTGGTANANPVILDSEGRANVWMDNSLAYKFALYDENDVLVFTVDNVRSLALQFSALNIAPYSYPHRYAIVNNQAATPLANQTWDGATYSSVRYEYEVRQGTTIFANGVFYLQYIASVWRVVTADVSDVGIENGLVFSVNQVGTVAALKVAETGNGNGSLSLKSSYHLQSP